MEQASDLERFAEYAKAFELAHAADRIDEVAPFFHEHAEHRMLGMAPAPLEKRGRDAVVGGLRASVAQVDRRFDARIPEILEGPFARPDGIWMRYALTLRRTGLPDLRLPAEHLTVYEDGRIRLLEETFPSGTAERMAAFFVEHAASLRPAGAAPAEPDARDQQDVSSAMARNLVLQYGGAKLQQDVGAALAVCSDDFVLESAAFGSRAVGRSQVAASLRAFFHAFPDYHLAPEGLAQSPGHLVSWGRVRISFRGELSGIRPTGKTADLPYVSLFELSDGALSRECFILDRAELCEQTGIPLAELAEAAGRRGLAGFA